MTGKCHRTVLAEQDVVEIAEFLSKQGSQLAIRFLDAVEATYRLLAEVPDMGSRCRFTSPHLRDIRIWHIAGFRNHLIYYREIDEGVLVVRVLHAARDSDAIFGET